MPDRNDNGTGALQVDIAEEPRVDLAAYSRVSIAFEVREILSVEVRNAGLGGLALSEVNAEAPYTKDYDLQGDEAPAAWPTRFDISRWGFLIARANAEIVGAAAVAVDTPELRLSEGRRDIALLWDIRVSPEVRGRGVGTALFAAAEAWAAHHRCSRLRVETQNTNLPACRFYAGQGCELEAIRRFAYPQFPAEVQLLWAKVLA